MKNTPELIALELDVTDRIGRLKKIQGTLMGLALFSNQQNQNDTYLRALNDMRMDIDYVVSDLVSMYQYIKDESEK